MLLRNARFGMPRLSSKNAGFFLDEDLEILLTPPLPSLRAFHDLSYPLLSQTQILSRSISRGLWVIRPAQKLWASLLTVMYITTF